MAQAQKANNGGEEPRRKSPERVRFVKDKLPEAKGQLKIKKNPDQPESTSGENLSVAFHEAAHIGKRKKEQQDAHGHLEMPADPASRRSAFHLVVIADGVSMGEAGALASRTAVEVAIRYFREKAEAGETDLSRVLADAFAAANLEVYKLAQTRPGMATTCAAALIAGRSLITAHVGDSRVYLSRPGLDLMPVTVDHSWVAEMGEILVQQGLMTKQALLRDPRRHTITRAFGLDEKIEVDINAAQLLPGDLIIACTDGLWDAIPAAQLEQYAREQAANLEAMTGRLVEAALNAGGRDNITVALARLDKPGAEVNFPSLAALLEKTANEVSLRTHPILPDLQPKTGASKAPSPSAKDYQPVGVVDEPVSNEVPAEIEDVPSMKLPSLPLDKLLAKAQKSFALGDWDAAINTYIELERLEASYQGLFESFSTALVRYIGIALGEGRVEQAETLIKKLEANKISRYSEILADYCNDESRRAATAQHYQAARAYAQFCLRLRGNDVRARTLSELADLYLAFQKPGISLSESLALAQKIYARDESYGGIQDDLAQVYMELGDEAVKKRNLEEAASWYSMISPLKPGDNRLLSLAHNKLRSVKDELARQSPNKSPGSGEMASPLNQANVATPLTGNAAAALRSLERERIINEGRPEQELVNRLKDRVSRAQKAWDNGRKEVGSEYIYLVDQLNELVPLNPWQSTFPRVCYDYAKWLYEQKQFEESRPYFQKAYTLGMAAAQQRLNEIDRLLKDKNAGPRRTVPVDLPDNSQTGRNPEFKSSFELPTDQRATNAAPVTSTLFTTRKSVPVSPLIPPKPEPPVDSTFVGASHAGDGVLSTEQPGVALPSTTPVRQPSVPPASVPSNPPTLPPRSAATIASGNWSHPIDEGEKTPPPGKKWRILKSAAKADNAETQESGNRAPVAASGTLRTPAALSGDPLKEAASREANRLAGTGLPQSLDPRRAALRRFDGFLSLVRGVFLPGLAVGIVVLGAILILTLVIPNFTRKNSPDSATGTTAALPSPAATAAPVLSGPQGIVRLQGIKPDDVKVFLATMGDPNSPYREFTLEGGFFRLPETTLNRLDPRQRYVAVIRPRDTDLRKYAENLAPESPAQQPFTISDITFDPVKGFDTTLRISAEAIAFYPLRGNDADQDLPGGGRYFGATKHSVLGEYLKYYNENGGLGRFGFPLSEEFAWEGNGQVQFFERGWLAIEAPGKPVVTGKVGRVLLDSACSTVPRVPPTATPVAIPTLKTDPAFAQATANFKLGPPQTQAFEVTNGTTKTKVQYFEQGRLEQNQTDKKATITLGLLGSEYARCSGWLR